MLKDLCSRCPPWPSLLRVVPAETAEELPSESGYLTGSERYHATMHDSILSMDKPFCSHHISRKDNFFLIKKLFGWKMSSGEYEWAEGIDADPAKFLNTFSLMSRSKDDLGNLIHSRLLPQVRSNLRLSSS